MFGYVRASTVVEDFVNAIYVKCDGLAVLKIGQPSIHSGHGWFVTSARFQMCMLLYKFHGAIR